MCMPNKPLDQCTLIKILCATLAALDVPDYASYTLHSLRRGGARACYAHRVPVTAIQAQGTWGSDAMYQYIPKQAPLDAPVALAAILG